MESASVRRTLGWIRWNAIWCYPNHFITTLYIKHLFKNIYYGNKFVIINEKTFLAVTDTSNLPENSSPYKKGRPQRLWQVLFGIPLGDSHRSKPRVSVEKARVSQIFN
jgi:hypothetical protein